MANNFFLKIGVSLSIVFAFSCSSNDSDGDRYEYDSITYQGKTYKTVKIGAQIWMAENLNYEVAGSICYNDSIAYCVKYGRLYNWATAMNLNSDCNYNECENKIHSKYQGICPDGWHIPNKADWLTLVNFAGGEETAGNKLKVTSGWSIGGNGTDEYGFSALPGGQAYYDDGRFEGIGFLSGWWCSSEYDDINDFYNSSNSAYALGIVLDTYRNKWDFATLAYGRKGYSFSIRCIQD